MSQSADQPFWRVGLYVVLGTVRAAANFTTDRLETFERFITEQVDECAEQQDSRQAWLRERFYHVSAVVDEVMDRFSKPEE